VESNLLVEMNRTLDTLIKNTHEFPTLAVIFPLEIGDSLMETRCRLVFMCSHTRKLVPCGDTEEKNGFIITATREWVQQVAPAMQCGLNVLADKMGDAILGKLYPDRTMLQSVVKGALNLVGSALSDKMSSTLHSIQNQEFASILMKDTVLEEGSRAACDAMRSFLAGRDIVASTGLIQQTAGGHTAWIKNDPEVIKSFHHRKGRRLE